MVARSDSLSRYREKRDFRITTEPDGGKTVYRQAGHVFLVQKHAASRLHYDLRLELGGVLLSWAVTRGPSSDPSQKRLAVRTEDHPLSYKDFEGNIPKGQYGGGTVMLWDVGSWTPLNDPEKGLAEGKLHFKLQGTRMQGGWALVRMRSDKNHKEGSRENWLLIKERDQSAVDDSEQLTETYDTSVVSGRSMEEIASGVAPKKGSAKRKSGPEDSSSKTGKSSEAGNRTGKSKSKSKSKSTDEAGTSQEHSGKLPRFHKLQLAKLVAEVPEGDDWIHEHKYDGYRCLAAVGKAGVRLYSRSGLDWSKKFASLESGIDALVCESALLDGEVVAREGGSKSSFSALQDALTNKAALAIHVFDLLHLNGQSLTDRPLLERKQALQTLLSDSPGATVNGVRYSEHVTGSGEEVLDAICKQGGEGIISKRADAAYRGRRSRDWLKIKCSRRQEFVIGGYSPSSRPGRAFASLLVGNVGDDGQLWYRGRIGSGFSAKTLEILGETLRGLSTTDCPFESVPDRIAFNARWVEPRCVVEVHFTEFTADELIRHGVFMGLREDKMASSVKLERADRKSSGNEKRATRANKVAGVAISSGDREVFPEAGISKQGVAEYYASVGSRMVDLASYRPLSLVRCPKGIDGECFFQKHAGNGFPHELQKIPIKESSGKTRTYCYFTSVAGLVAAAQMGTIEFHTWGARTDNLEKPDRLVFDLDPDQDLDFAEVKQAAIDIRKRLAKLGLASTAMVTGGKGIHVIVWLRRTVSWQTLSLFAKSFAHVMSSQEPGRFTASMSKAHRRNRIFIDWLRNERGATTIAPYSLRSRQGAPVAMPVSWNELQLLDSANEFSIKDVVSRLKRPCPLSKGRYGLQTLSGKTVESLVEESTGEGPD